MPGMMLTDAFWEKLSQRRKQTGRVDSKPAHRMTVEGILYQMRTGCPWRDLPSEFGKWSAVFRRFNLWSRKGILHVIFSRISEETEEEWLFIDGNIVRTHQHGTGAASTTAEAIGKSRGGNSTKIHLAVNSYRVDTFMTLLAPRSW